MFSKIVTKSIRHFTFSLFASPKFTMSTSNYQPPQSQLQQFIHHISQIEKDESFNKAAELMATLQADESIYRNMLNEMNEKLSSFEQNQTVVVNVVRKRNQLQEQIRNGLQENQAILKRCDKQIENIKVYGISRIAREVIEVADHLSKAIQSCQKNHHSKHQVQLKNLQKLHQQLNNFLMKYEIYQVDPINNFFDPNQHHAIGFIETQDPSQSNMVAETKRTGWKLRDRVLRQASVVIYK